MRNIDSKQILTRLPVLLAQIKARGNFSKKRNQIHIVSTLSTQ